MAPQSSSYTKLIALDKSKIEAYEEKHTPGVIICLQLMNGHTLEFLL